MHTNTRLSSELAQLVKETLVLDPASLLGAGRVDPFAQYPILFELMSFMSWWTTVSQRNVHLEALLTPQVLFIAPSLQSKP
jgi:hypothetical protein